MPAQWLPSPAAVRTAHHSAHPPRSRRCSAAGQCPESAPPLAGTGPRLMRTGGAEGGRMRQAGRQDSSRTTTRQGRWQGNPAYPQPRHPSWLLSRPAANTASTLTLSTQHPPRHLSPPASQPAIPPSSLPATQPPSQQHPASHPPSQPPSQPCLPTSQHHPPSLLLASTTHHPCCWPALRWSLRGGQPPPATTAWTGWSAPPAPGGAAVRGAACRAVHYVKQYVEQYMEQYMGKCMGQYEDRCQGVSRGAVRGRRDAGDRG